MQLVIEIPDDIIARSTDDVVDISLELDSIGRITDVYNQDYGFRHLTYASMNELGKVDIIKLKNKLKENEDNGYTL